MDGGQGKRVFVKKDMFNGPNIIEKKKRVSWVWHMEITGLLGQSSLGRKARTDAMLLVLKMEEVGFRKEKKIIFSQSF